METNAQEIGRREFLLLSSTCALAAVVGTKVFGAEAVSQPARVAVGFAPFDEGAIVSAASDVLAPDGGFISRGARVSISGASGAFGDPAVRRMVGLKAQYSYFEGAQESVAPFHAWGCSRATGCQGSPVSFTVPVDVTQKLSFRVVVETGSPAGSPTSRRRAIGGGAVTEELELELSLRSDAPFKLDRGYYVLVPLIDGESLPQWSRFELRSVGGRWALHDHDGNAVSFEHFVLRIDYAS